MRPLTVLIIGQIDFSGRGGREGGRKGGREIKVSAV